MNDLAVLIIGGSVTGGGGVENRSKHAWRKALRNVHATVRFKGAIDPSYFLHCTARFVEHSYDVVLFDLGANMGPAGSASSLVELIRRVRCLANASAVGVVNWPGWPGRPNPYRTRWAANEARAALIEVPYGPELYSTDRVHPNERGHALIAERVLAYLGSVDASTRAVPYASYDCAAHVFEQCYPSAPGMPVVRDATGEPHGWKLVDDSPAPKLVHKYGWVPSGQRGAPLTMVVPPGDTCGLIVTVSYLASNVTGSFRLGCEAGCAISPLRKWFQDALDPFPIITGHGFWSMMRKKRNPTTTNSTRNPYQPKTTHDTTFHLLRQREEACRLTVAPITDERVRIDALYVREPDAAYADATSHSRLSTFEQWRFGMYARRRGHCNASWRAPLTRR